ncbi:hypothetical protein HOK51_08160 [Candidatus Woesearchaeota archaeon]|jgi:hypothetical protein|nr:hypothetical protein [Candidatus Woesearchaeota archaeon]MBT6519798.1 hypothetical protein [Candidatus Woesearchaeota archaeon]MBT7368177.1 hypothetical protein [Candidatus Woesearchaeota archaeon]
MTNKKTDTTDNKTHKYSPSSIGLLERCPKCFYLQMNCKVRRPSGPFPSLPSGMDYKLKPYFDGYRSQGKRPPELSELEESIGLFSDEKLMKEWRNNWKGVSWEDSKGNTFRGAVDEILINNSNDKLIVLDYKTRGFKLKENTAGYYQNQLDIYNLLLRRNGFETEDYSFLLFYMPEEIQEEGIVKFNTQLVKMDVNVKSADKLFRKARKVLRGEMPESAEDCGFCEWAEKMKEF